MTITDSRPRHMYRLPDGREVPIIFDHGEVPPQTSTFQLEGGEVVPMTLVATADNLTDGQIRDWESDELARLRSPKKRGDVVDLATESLLTGVDPTDGIPLSRERRASRQRIADAINARAKAGAR